MGDYLTNMCRIRKMKDSQKKSATEEGNQIPNELILASNCLRVWWVFGKRLPAASENLYVSAEKSSDAMIYWQTRKETKEWPLILACPYIKHEYIVNSFIRNNKPKSSLNSVKHKNYMWNSAFVTKGRKPISCGAYIVFRFIVFCAWLDNT